MDTLLAKSRNRRGVALGLFQHLDDTERAIGEVFRHGSRWRSAWLRFFGIDADQGGEFWRTLSVAALFHDLGKANHDFQRAVTVPNAPAQAVRHEHLSALVLCLPECHEWLAAAGLDVDLIIGAVLSHHVKASDSGKYQWCQSSGASSVELYLQHQDVGRTLERVRALLGLEALPSLPTERWKSAPPWSLAFERGHAQANKLRRQLKKDPQKRRVLAALKAGLIVADSVASAVFREGKSMADWLNRNAHTEAISADEISSAIIQPRAREVERGSGKAFSLHSFQNLSALEGPRTVLLAPCGAGKTLAAWIWARRQAQEHRFGRVIFLYPTRGTATEGYRDYVGWAPEGDATLLHGSSAFELAAMSDNPPESLQGKDTSAAEAQARMFALGLWRFRFFSATVDQFLSFMQNRYESLCLLPALADSVIVLDEVHSYDPKMFELLLSFLREFDVPVLCMTATLPPQRLERLLEAGLTPFPRPEHRAQLADLTDTAECPRYRISFEPDAAVAVAAGVDAFRRGHRVLIVVNRVARCVEVAKFIEVAIGTRPLVYHSRFCLAHRQERHREVVSAFKGHARAIAVTTQVCEMSLDLDAQTLVTEVAPVTSLVQRFGRANRHLRDRSFRAEIIVYPPAKEAPYDSAELAIATQFVVSVTGESTQSQLNAALATGQFSLKEVDLGDDGNFLTGGYYAVQGSLREEDEYSVQCVLDGDLSVVEQLHKSGREIDGYLLPAPRHLSFEIASGLPPYIRAASSDRYTSFYGLES